MLATATTVVSEQEQLPPQEIEDSKALFIWLIIRLIQFVFSAETVFFSCEKSANSVFQLAYNTSRTAPKSPPDNRSWIPC
jgi:hypothetical protein